MTEKQFNEVVNKAVTLGNKYRKEMSKLEEWCEKEYGCVWNDLDCDDIIDALQFGCGKLSTMTFQDFKESIESKL